MGDPSETKNGRPERVAAKPAKCVPLAMSKTVQVTSLELGWLARRDKLLPVPEVVFSSAGKDFGGGRCSGCYYRPERNEYIFEDVYVPFDRGVILASARDSDAEDVANTLAHEWRHHWQHHHGLLPAKTAFNMSRFEDFYTYDAAIRDYFRSQPHEMDALLFQRRTAKPTSFTDATLGRVFGGI